MDLSIGVLEPELHGPKRAAVLWTGGKDCSMSLYQAKLQGYEINRLVTFVPSKAEFLAHPLCFMKYQAEAMALPHYLVTVNEPFKEGYEKAILSLRDLYGIDTLVTGDIAEVGGHPNWIRERSRSSGIDVLTPLWGIDGREHIRRLLACKFKVVFSFVKKPWFSADSWLGMELDQDSFKTLCGISEDTGLDVCGEQGEYHTLVVDGPIFKKKIHIDSYSKHARDSMMYINIEEVALQEKLQFKA